eukprot:CAMPEP_0116895370 /NCGR_PEP_ID=MMETSP0467-20121206/4910_1 /TAXON_ID=283647 /ORGANISM="Mesodinium pulex, Strain SPMC105" /LENGTH=64 /DNA_ID=CAMNT_0004566065 /DNA_START=1584 /DNA_END=1778 /DNA_ORIENTATION=+
MFEHEEFAKWWLTDGLLNYINIGRPIENIKRLSNDGMPTPQIVMNNKAKNPQNFVKLDNDTLLK